jgi:O-antigen ligase
VRLYRQTPAAGFRELWRPATAVLLLLPASLLAGGASTISRFGVVAVVAVLVLIMAALVAVGTLPFQRPYLWIALFAGLLVVSFAFPRLAPANVPLSRQRIVDLFGILRALTPTRLARLTDLVGLLAGIGLLVISVATSPRPRHVAPVIALTGSVAAAYMIMRGGYASGRLEGLGLNANYLGVLLALPLVAAVGLMRSRRIARWLVPAAVCFVALTDTQSRGAFLAAAAGVFFVFVQGRSLRFRLFVAGAGAVAGVVVVLTGKSLAVHRIVASLGAGDRTDLEMSSDNALRIRVAGVAVHAVLENPLRGVGYRMFPTYAQRSSNFGEYLDTHNDYLRLGAEAGVLTLAVFLVLLWLGTWRGQAGDTAALRAVVVAYAVALLFANTLANLVITAPFWVSLGCLLTRATPRSDLCGEAASRARQRCP